MGKELTFGDMIQSYKIIGMSSDHRVLAKSETAPDSFVVWHLDSDKCGVWGGIYCSTYEQAQEVLLS